MEFAKAYQINRRVIFEVRYTTVGDNASPYFATSAAEFNQPKSDYKRCGQAQEELLPKGSSARRFWKKWDAHHLHRLTDDQLEELRQDCDELEEHYNCLTIEHEKFGNTYRTPSFNVLKALSKLPVKKAQKKA